jgi:predicted kinase
MSKELLILVGLPFAGKSTHAKYLASRRPYQIIEGACIGKAMNTEGYEISNENMDPVYTVERIMFKAFAQRELPVIIDDRNLLIESIYLWKNLAFSVDYRVLVKIIDTPVDICIRRAKEAGKDERIIRHIDLCSERLQELRTMFGFKHQNILDNFEVIKTEEDK